MTVSTASSFVRAPSAETLVPAHASGQLSGQMAELQRPLEISLQAFESLFARMPLPLSGSHTHNREGAAVVLWDGTTKTFLFGEPPPVNCTGEFDGQYTNVSIAHVKARCPADRQDWGIYPVYSFSADPVSYLQAPDLEVLSEFCRNLQGWNPDTDAPTSLNTSNVQQPITFKLFNFSQTCIGDEPMPAGPTVSPAHNSDRTDANWVAAEKTVTTLAGVGVLVAACIKIKSCLAVRQQARVGDRLPELEMQATPPLPSAQLSS